MTASLRIEPMRECHLDAVLAIERRSFGAPWTRGMFEQEVAEHAFARPFVALDGGCVVGFAVSWFLADEAHLLNVAVDPGVRRRGIGRALVDHVLARARAEGRRLVTLEVRPGNAPARALYEALGFRAVARRRGYYTDTGEDAIVMVRRLDEAPPGIPASDDGAPGGGGARAGRGEPAGDPEGGT